MGNGEMGVLVGVFFFLSFFSLRFFSFFFLPVLPIYIFIHSA